MDDVDRAIITCLRREARMPVAEVARRVGVTRATVHERWKRLSESGVVRGAHLDLDPGALGRPLRAFILVQWSTEKEADQRQVARAIADIPGVDRVHNVTGKHDFLVEVVGRDMDEVGRIILERIRVLPGVGATETLIAFWSFEGHGVPLDG